MHPTKLRGVGSANELLVGYDEPKQAQVGLDPTDTQRLERPLGAVERLLACGAPDDQFGEERIVADGNLGAGVGVGVDTQIGPAREMKATNPPRARKVAMQGSSALMRQKMAWPSKCT